MARCVFFHNTLVGQRNYCNKILEHGENDSLKKWKILKEQNEEYEKQIKEIKTSLNNILKLLEEVRVATDKEHLR